MTKNERILKELERLIAITDWPDKAAKEACVHPATLQAAVRTACCWTLRCKVASGLGLTCAA